MTFPGDMLLSSIFFGSGVTSFSLDIHNLEHFLAITSNFSLI